VTCQQSWRYLQNRPKPKLVGWRGMAGLAVINRVALSSRKRLSRLSSLCFRHDSRPQSPVRQIVEVEELRGATVIEPNFIAATVSNGLVLSEVYIGHAPMMPRSLPVRKSSIG
jgi:hypothetical protein